MENVRRPRKQAKTSLPEFPDPAMLFPRATAAAIVNTAFNQITVEDNIIPKQWAERAKRAWDYYLLEPLIKNCVNSWRSFAIGDMLKVSANDDDVKGDVDAACKRLEIVEWVKDMTIQLLTKGDTVAYKRYTKDGGDIEEVQCVNSTSIRVKYAEGALVEIRQIPDTSTDTGTGGYSPYQNTAGSSFQAGDGVALNVEQALHLKWDAPEFSPRGNSMVLPAFDSLELLRDYRRAERAIAKRWATPLRFIKVGGAYGQKMIMPDQRMLDSIRDVINNMDMRSGVVVPFYVDCQTYGTDSGVLNLDEKLKEAKEDVMVAMGFPKALITGDGPNYATAEVSLQKMLIMIREIKRIARQMLEWVFDDWSTLKGYDATTIKFEFNGLDLSDEVDYRKLLLEMYDRKLISKSTLQTKMDLDPVIEKDNRELENQIPDLTDEKVTGPIASLVAAGVITVDEGRALLGLKPLAPTGDTVAQADLNATAQDGHCGDCGFFDADTNRCPVHNCDRSFSTRACRLINRK